MKLTKARLQQIIKEEINAAIVTEQPKAEAKVDELMQSQLFWLRTQTKKDKAEARSIILDTLKSLEANGGTKRPDEEYMDECVPRTRRGSPSKKVSGCISCGLPQLLVRRP